MTSNYLEEDAFSLDNFEGPLSFLLHLIRKSEIDIRDIPIQEITAQYLNKFKPSIESGAEFVGTTAFLLWIKSKMLLPKHTHQEGEEEEFDPNFEEIYQLLDYYRFKNATHFFTERESQQSVYYTRGVPDIPEAKKKFGVEHLTLKELEDIFRDILERAPSSKGKILEERWRVSEKINVIRDFVKSGEPIRINQLFFKEKPKGELIVTFLAVLELMKIGEVFLGKETETKKVMIFPVEVTQDDPR